MLVDRMEVLRKVFANAGILIAAHCEEQSIISANTTAFKEKYGEDPDIKYHPQIRSAEACVYSSSLAIRLAKENNARLQDRKSTRLNSSHLKLSRMPSSA